MKGVSSLFQKIPSRTRTVVETCAYGLVASLGAVAFQLAIKWVYDRGFIEASHSSNFIWISLGFIVIGSLISGWLLNHYCPEAAGSGIPQQKLAFWKDFGHTPVRIAWIKFVAGVLSIGGGQSLGREGPSVQIGGNLSSTVAGWMGVAKQNKRTAAAAGSAAGLAAAFNAPLAGVAFVLEEILEDLNSRFLGAVLVAAVIGAFVVHAIIGAQPAFLMPVISEPGWQAYLLIPFCAALSAFIGVYFQRWCLQLRAVSNSYKQIPRLYHPLIGGLMTWGLGMAVFYGTGRLGVFSLGYEDLTAALNNSLAWKVAGILCVAKLAATIFCYGTGGCGGIFSPNLFFGGMCGAVVAGVASQFMDLTDSSKLMLVVAGMSSCLGAVVQAPVTAILIIFEMTHQFSLIPGLMMAGLVSQVVARSMNRMNFYEEVLHQDGYKMEHIIPPRDLRSWQNLPVSAIAKFQPMVVEKLENADLKALLDKAPFRYFPVTENDLLTGFLGRLEIEASIAESRTPRLLSPASVRPSQTIRECQKALIDSPAGIVVLSEKPDGRPLAVLTLHDLLRAQSMMSDRE